MFTYKLYCSDCNDKLEMQIWICLSQGGEEPYCIHNISNPCLSKHVHSKGFPTPLPGTASAPSIHQVLPKQSNLSESWDKICIIIQKCVILI